MLNFLKKIFGGGTHLDWEDLLERKAQIIDVRTPAEYRRGHVSGSRNIPLSDLGRHAKKLKKTKKPIVTCCASGNRSGIAQRKLTEMGMEVYNGGPWTSVARQLR